MVPLASYLLLRRLELSPNPKKKLVSPYLPTIFADRSFFAPAVRAIASLIDSEPEAPFEIALVCEPDDVAPGFDRLPAALRERINLITVDFSKLDGIIWIIW
jgi:hypothetical protein